MCIIPNCPKLYKFHFRDWMFYYRYTIDYLNHSSLYRILNWILFHFITIICVHNEIFSTLWIMPTLTIPKNDCFDKVVIIITFFFSFGHFIDERQLFQFTFLLLGHFLHMFKYFFSFLQKHLIDTRSKKHIIHAFQEYLVWWSMYFSYIFVHVSVCYCFEF